ncbi:hypothetical protein DTO013E5_2003 [Penicillium roqueforti]|uniref:FAR-17a/AIG1-like protein n=1 Tax=Penicillium roqueforti (strain FM164) TaxID=1365484 RepID=W6Q5Z6_PENRF|nr:hypothetical protein CBS147332_4064 [Penicillium roqueforti]CDM31735.1 FAR-17a/AIG1-like protein [Penicillium roqueforti FM164]KAI2725628.1 hypothetical protein CBS147354_4799 [Penicillium roqueforti]KAI2741010.1 hypothetical protein DTO012A1_4784 [Penicillium roqueforti]KAI2749580.1 hypothetical protein DTO013F2_5395 [Penicillium roqueforti]
MPRRSLATLFGVDRTTDVKHHFETSWILPPAVLAGLRGLISLYIFASIFIFWGWYGTHDDPASIGHSFSYFTWLTYWGTGFYMLFAAIHTAYYVRTGHSVLLDRWPRVFRVLHSLLYVTVTTFPILVTVVFWAILFSPPWYKEPFTRWQNISQHVLNSVYALLEIILPATAPHPFIAIPFLLLILLLYLCVAYITHETEGWYPYSFLDVGDHGQKSNLVTGYCFGVLAAVLVFFVISWALIHLRRRLTRGGIKRATRDPLCAHEAFSDACFGESSNERKVVPV